MSETATLALTPREERVRVLLEWYQDAVETMDRSGDMSYSGAPGSVCLLMGELWRHPSYRDLERALQRFRVAEPVLWWNVRERFITNTARTVLACPRCPATAEIAAKHFTYNDDGDRTIKLKHKHGDTVFFVLRTVPVVSKAIDPELVDAGIRWIAGAMRGDAFVPDLILGRRAA